MKTIYVLCMLFALAMTSMKAIGKDSSYVYKAWPDQAKIEVDLVQSEVTLNNHSVIPLRPCGTADGWTCLQAGSFFFATPTGPVLVGQKFAAGAHRFRIAKRVEWQALGKSFEGYLIHHSAGGDKYWYLYSTTAGIILFGSAKAGHHTTFLLEGQCGLGVPADCGTKLEGKGPN